MSNPKQTAVLKAALNATAALINLDRAEPNAAKAVREFIDASLADPHGFKKLRQAKKVSADVKEGVSPTTVMIKCVCGAEDKDGKWVPKGAGTISRHTMVQDLATAEGIAAVQYDDWLPC